MDSIFELEQTDISLIELNEKEQTLFSVFLDSKESDMVPSMEVQALEIRNCFDEIVELRYENWVNLDTNARLDALNELEGKVAEISHRPPMIVKTEEMKKGLVGYYNGSGLFLSQSILNSNSQTDYRQALSTLFHEGRHAYQYYNLYDTQVEQNQEMVDAWRVNLDILKYDDGERLIFKDLGYYEYYTQPIEVDARVFSAEVMRELGI